MKTLIFLALMTSSLGFFRSIQCELTRHDYFNDAEISNSVIVNVADRECQSGINLDDSEYGNDNYNYKICSEKKKYTVAIYPGESSRGNGLFKAKIAELEYEYSELNKEINLIQNVSIYCR